MGYIYILGTIVLTVYGQLIIKWQVAQAGNLPYGMSEKLLFLARITINPWVVSSLAAAFLAFIFWMAALTKFDLSFAYPFMSLSFVLVAILSSVFLNESLTLFKLLGVILIVIGITISSRG